MALKIALDCSLDDLHALSRVCHPAIPSIIDAGTVPCSFVAMELAQGTALGTLMADTGVTLDDALHVCAVVADALAALHDAGMTHNDVKPDNVVVSGSRPRRVTLVDLGMSGTQGGTLAYAAPERTSGGEGSEEADVYSLGLMLWEMLHGSLPWSELPDAEAVVRRRRGVGDVEVGPKWLRRLLSEMLAVRPAERPSASRLVDTLAAHGVAVPVPDAGLLDRRARAVQLERPELHGPLTRLAEASATLAVVGPTGAGCSHLLLRQWREKVAAGEQVLLMTPDGTPWGTVVAALADPCLPGEPSTLPREASPEARAAMAAEIIRKRAEGTIWVLVDDWHAADQGTRLTVECLASLDDVFVLVAGEEAPGWAQECVDLAPLDVERIERLVFGILGQAVGLEPLLRAITEAGAVWPGTVRSLVSKAVRNGGLVFHGRRWIVVEEALRGLADDVPIVDGISGLDADSRQVAELLGAEQGPVRRAVLRQVLGLSKRQCDAAIDALTAAELVIADPVQVRPVHGAAAAAMAPTGERVRDVHALLARTFASMDPVPVHRLGRHVLASGDTKLAWRFGIEIVDALEAADPHAAATVGMALLRLTPGTALAVSVVRALVAAGDIDEARRTAATVLHEADEGPGLVPLHLALARVLSAHEQRHEDALAQVARARALRETVSLALLEVHAQVLFRAGRFAEAIEVAVSAPEPAQDNPREVDAWLGLVTAHAQSLQASGSLEEAVTLLRDLDADLGRGRARRALADAALGRLLWIQGAPRDAAGALARAARADSGLGALDRARASFNLGSAWFQVGERGKALAAWEGAELLFSRLRAREDCVRVAVNLTVGYRETGRWEQARQMGRRAVRDGARYILPELEAMAAGNLGDVELATGDYDAAERWYARATVLGERHGLTGELAELARRRAELAVRTGADALRLAERARTVTKGCAGEYARASMLWQVACVRSQMPADVLSSLEEVSGPLLAAGDQGGLAWARVWAAEAAAEQGLVPDARELVERVATWAAEVGHAELLALCGRMQDRLSKPQLGGAEQVLELAARLARETDADRVLQEISRAACELMDAERACVAVPGDDALQLVAFSHEAFEPSSSVMEAVLRKGREVLSTDLEDRADLRMRSSVHAMELRSVLCVPILDRGETLGALYADSRMASRRQLSESVGLMRGLSGLAAMALVRLRTDALAAADVAHREKVRRLQTAEEEIQALAGRLKSRNSELVELNRALAAAADAERAAAESRARFLATMSHEFRTPMNGVLGMVDLLETMPATATQRDHLAVIRRSGELMLDMVDQVLTSSRLEAGRYELNNATFDLHEVCRRVVEQVRFCPHAHGLTLALDLGGDASGVVYGDEGALQQVLMNLLGNAVRFTDEGTVRLRVRCDADRVRVQVTDSGIGIAKEHQDTIFQPFVQVRDARRGGTGLGLSITADLVRLMGGSIRCTSQLGLGTTFSFDAHLPRALAPATAHTAVVEPRVQGSRILVVEDNAVNVMVAMRQLESFGCIPDHALTCRDAIEAVQMRGPYDLILLDWELPDGTGGEIAQTLRSLQLVDGVPLVALTAHSGEVNRSRSFEAGLDDHMVKPLRRDDLAELLHRWLDAGREQLNSPLLDRGLVAS